MTERLSITQLEILDRLLVLGSVSAVAEALGVAQPSVSLQLRNLRNKLDDPLFVRAGNRLVPTPHALALRDPVEKALAAMDRLSLAPSDFDPARLRETFRIAMTDASQVTLLPRLMNRVRDEAPGVSLAVNLISRETRRSLRDGELDLALGYVPQLGEDMMVQRLFYQDWVCLCAPRAPLSLADYEAAEHVHVTSGTGTGLLERAVMAASIERKVRLSLPGFLGLAGVLEDSPLVATLPRHIATTLAARSKVVVLDCPLSIETFSVSQYWHERMSRDAAQRWLRECSRRAFHFDGIVSGWAPGND
jgi:DNA-binding transcriptional LysR family regulator